MNRLIILAVFMFSLSLPSYAQFIGIRIGIPSNSLNGSGNAVPSGAIQDDAGHFINDDASHYIIAG